MAEEHTVSNFTKINMADWAHQKASTIVNMMKIKQYICHSEILVCLPLDVDQIYSTCSHQSLVHPVVCFYNLLSHIHDAAKPVHATAATAPTTTSEPTPSTSPPTNPTVPELTLSGANKGSESPDVSEAGKDNELELDEVQEDADQGCDDNKNVEVLRAAHEQASGNMMDVQCNDRVDVSVPQLLDYLSNMPSCGLLVPDSVLTGVKKQAADGASPKVFEVSDIQF